MGFIPPGASKRFRPVDQKAAYAAFKSSGSFDPDTLYAQKESMVAPYRTLKRLALIGVVAGLLLTSLHAAVLAIAILVGAAMLWRFQARQVRYIEAGYAQYVGAEAP